jgi:H2-forming N5,N10-methylenetetrahydromethanopterin dehydrogenase-like enzyme
MSSSMRLVATEQHYGAMPRAGATLAQEMVDAGYDVEFVEAIPR